MLRIAEHFLRIAVFHYFALIHNGDLPAHPANHAQVVYAPDADTADRALTAKAAMFAKLGVRVHLIGDTPLV